MTMELVEDLGDGLFTAKDGKGNLIRLRTINVHEIKKRHKQRILNAIGSLSKRQIDKLFKMTNACVVSTIDIDDWNTKATEISDYLKVLYEKIGNPNIFHHYIKDIDPKYYGKASTFRKQCKSLSTICIEMKDMKLNVNERF